MPDESPQSTAILKKWFALYFDISMFDQSHPYGAIQKADSPLHPLIAHEILGPIITSYGENGEGIYPWRFHRHFEPAKNFHRFTFRFRSEEEICKKVRRKISANQLFEELKQAGVLQVNTEGELTCSDKGPDGLPGYWSEEINVIWPHFIFGVSRAWLEAIIIFVKAELDRGIKYESLDRKLDLYTKVNEHIAMHWYQDGQNAFLHHLNAVFGYEPTGILMNDGKKHPVRL